MPRGTQLQWTTAHDLVLQKVLEEEDSEIAPLTGKPVKDINPIFSPFTSGKLNSKIEQIRASLKAKRDGTGASNHGGEGAVKPLILGGGCKSIKRLLGKRRASSRVDSKSDDAVPHMISDHVSDLLWDVMAFHDPDRNTNNFVVLVSVIMNTRMEVQVSEDGWRFVLTITEHEPDPVHFLDPSKLAVDGTTLAKCPESLAILLHFREKDPRSTRVEIPLPKRVYPHVECRKIMGAKFANVVVRFAYRLTVWTDSANVPNGTRDGIH